MKQYLIKGGIPLRGEVTIGGAKNAALGSIVAAIMAKGETEVKKLHHIDRGYENFTQKLQGLGVNVQRVPYDAKDYETLDSKAVPSR